MTGTVQENQRVVPNLIVVVDPDYELHLETAARVAPVWIVSTKTNRDACERLWKIKPLADHCEKGGITSYKVRAPEDRLKNLLDIVPELETHHGEIKAGEFCFPVGFILEVVGLSLTEHVIKELCELGFTSFTETTDGFQANK